MVIGVGISRRPRSSRATPRARPSFLGAWLLGGVISLCGALVYAELSATPPETGGEYTFLQHAFGRGAAFLFAWSRMTVMPDRCHRRGRFRIGEYASEIYRLGDLSTAILRRTLGGGLTMLNFAAPCSRNCCRRSWRLRLSPGCCFLRAPVVRGRHAKPAAPGGGGGDFLFAMMFVFFTFGGWNESRLPRRRSARAAVATCCAFSSAASSRSLRSICW